MKLVMKLLLTTWMILGLSNNIKVKTETRNQYSTKYKFSTVSWYGPGFNGNKTASGEIFDENKLTCASPNLPFGTLVKVVNISNEKSVIVRVNDRGPFAVHSGGYLVRPLKPHPNRALDLSKKAFSEIADIKKGVIKVRYKIVEKQS